MPLDQDPIPQRPSGSGRLYWRSLEELMDTEEFREHLGREFPEQASEWTDPVTRRQFLTLMGASLALAGLSGCSTPRAGATVTPLLCGQAAACALCIRSGSTSR